MNAISKAIENIQPNTIIRVDDVDLIIEHDDKAPKTLPDFLIKSKRVFADEGYTKTILTLDHIGSDIEYLLVCESFNDVCDITLYSHLDFFKPNSRSVLQASDLGWLFDGNGYPQEVYNDEIVFKRRVVQEVFGNTAIIDWTTETPIVNYKLMLIETGIYHDNGGWVEFYEGRQIPEDQIKF